MKAGWKKTPLGDVIEIHDSRRIPLSGAQRSQRPGKYPYYGAQSIIDYIDDYIFDGKFLLIAEDGENLRSRKEPIASFTCGKFWVNNHAHIVTAKPELADDYFIKACLNSANLAAYVTGAAQPKLSQGNLKQIEINLPDLPTQRKIAGILSAYDDLIENNLRRIKILEEMAQSLYREWFVHFRFPGHESARFMDSSLGRIPKGWDVRKILDFADVIYGFSFKANRFNNAGEGLPVVRIRNIQDGQSTTFTGENGDPKHRIQNGDILVGMDGDFHLKIWSGGEAWQNQRVAKFRPKGAMGKYLLFLTLEKPIHFFNSTITGTTVAHLGDSHIKTIEFASPPEALMRKASELLEPMAQEQLNLRRRNETLRRTRDLLLPKLLTPA